MTLEMLPEDWYCAECAAPPASEPSRKYRRAFAHFNTRLERVLPKEFSLPERIKNYFEAVKTGPEGAYDEVQPPAAKPAKKKNGYEEAPDFFKIRDTDGSAVLCHNCQAPTSTNRAIIPCSICGLYWHLDCLDPPLAIPPPLRTWVCPAHVKDVTIELPAGLAPAHKHRRVKRAPSFKPAFGRGGRNNGFIEIEYESDEDDHSGWRVAPMFGKNPVLPANGVILDFVEQYVAPSARQLMFFAPRCSSSYLFTLTCHAECTRRARVSQMVTRRGMPPISPAPSWWNHYPRSG
jgi:hypothetical protein